MTTTRQPTVVAVLFGVLVAATFAAFFVAQRLKSSPSVVQGLRRTPLFSPNGDGRKDRAHVTFKLKKADDVTVQLLGARGDVVRTLLDDRHLEAYSPITPSLTWDGTDDHHRAVPDGRYRIRITLRRQGRAVVDPRSIVKDTVPPRPRVTSIGPYAGPGPELLPEPTGKPAVVHFEPALGQARIHVFKTAPGRPREVLVENLRRGDRSWRWDGRVAGRRVSPGTYLVVPEWRDVAGNVGTSVPLDARGLPVLTGGPLRGRGGITVRYLAVRPPIMPVRAGDPLQLLVDSRQKRYTWSLRRLGESQPRKRSGRPKTSPTVTVRAPGGAGGVYIFEARTRTHATRVVVPIQARRPVAGTAARPRGALVVLPVITWQGRNPVDDDGDGAPNVLDLGGPARLFRVMGGDGLPVGFTEREAPVLQWLHRSGRTYDVTTDIALLTGRGPRLTGHRGVLIPGDARWLAGRVRDDLRTFARRGGTVVSLGIDSLRRGVRLDGEGRLSRPTAPRATDAFGARVRPLVRQTTDLEVFQQDPKVDLFAGGPGLFAGVHAWEESAVGREADLVSNAVTQSPAGKTVVVAARFGRGLVIRPGFPEFAPRLASPTPDPAVSALMARMWTLLSR